jgi:hypothetical protein
VIRHNCTGVAETLMTKCLPPVTMPVCRLLVNDEPVLDVSLCKVLWYNSTRTRCQCTLSESVMQARRLVGDNDNGVVTYVRSYTVVMMAEHVGNTFQLVNVSKSHYRHCSPGCDRWCCFISYHKSAG